MAYCTEQQVYDATGLTSAKVEDIIGKDPATIITSFITWGEKTIQEWVRSPIIQREELHYGNGEKYEFDLGPHDEENSGGYDPLNDVNKVYNVIFNRTLMKQPYPKTDCDLGCENESSDWGTSNVTLTDESTTVKCQSYSIKGVFSAAGYMRYPSGENLNKGIDVYDWVAFRFRVNDATKTFTLKLYDRSGNSNTYDFTVHKADVWYIVMIKIGDMTGSIQWSGENLYYLDIYSDGACTVYVDNLNFNDGVFWTIPQGKFVVCAKIKPTYTAISGIYGDGYEFYITYDFDPFNTTVPDNIVEACACLAGVKLLDHLLGFRVQDTGFVLDVETGEVRADKLTLEVTRRRILKRAKELVGQYGYGFDSGIA